MQLNTRFVFTPTGPAHIGHVWTAYINWQMARITGGQFWYRFEDVLAMQNKHLREPVREGGLPLAQHYAEENLADMTAIGLPPSKGCLWRQSRHSIADYYWKLYGFEHVFGPWPGELREGMRHPPWGANVDTAAEHPYVTLSRVSADIATGCNVVLRGVSLAHENSMYMMWAHLLLAHLPLDKRKEAIPKLRYIPELKWTEGREVGAAAYARATRISSSSPDAVGNVFVKDVLDAGISGETLFEYLEKIYYHRPLTYTERVHEYLTPGSQVITNFAANVHPMNPYPLVHRHDWERFLETGEVGDWQRVDFPEAEWDKCTWD